MNFEAVIDGVLASEGGYVNDPSDAGGETNFGITVAVARANGYDGPMRDLPVSLARQIYRNRYIVSPSFDKVAVIDEAIAGELIDTGVNMGPSRAAEFLQRWLNGFNDTGSRYQDIFVDARIGPVTLDALRAFLRWRGADGTTVLMRGLNDLQGTRYLELAEGNRSQRKFLFGWMLQRVR